MYRSDTSSGSTSSLNNGAMLMEQGLTWPYRATYGLTGPRRGLTGPRRGLTGPRRGLTTMSNCVADKVL